MRYALFLICFLLLESASAQGQIAEGKFHEGSNYFINGNTQAALGSVTEGLKMDPSNKKLQALKKLLEEQKKKQEQQKKQQQQQEKKDQQQNNDQKGDKKEQEKKQEKQKSEEKKNEEKKEDQEEKERKEEQEKLEQQKKEIPDDVREKLKQMKIDPEKAKMILEAMRNQEVQYLQQRTRESKKPRERSKPDW